MTVKLKNILRVGALTFLLTSTGCSSKPDVTVVIQPYETFDVSLSDTVAKALQQNYGAQIFLLPHQPLPQTAFIQSKSARYRADSLIRWLKKNKPAYSNYILGLTTQDIAFTKRNEDGTIKKPASKYSDWGIFGLGYMPGSSCIVSSYRLYHSDQKIFIARLKKVAIHELGHNLGLPHCDSKGCVMQDAVEHIQTIDQANASLCPTCKKNIQ